MLLILLCMTLSHVHSMSCNSPFQKSQVFADGPQNLDESIALKNEWSSCSNLREQKETCCGEDVLSASGGYLQNITTALDRINAGGDKELLLSFTNLTFSYSLLINVTAKYRELYSLLNQRKSAVFMNKGVVDPVSQWVAYLDSLTAQFNDFVSNYKLNYSSYQGARQVCQDLLIDVTSKIRCLGCQANVTDFYNETSKSLRFDSHLCSAITASCYPLFRLQEFATKNSNSSEFAGKLNTTIPIAQGVQEALDKLKGDVSAYFDRAQETPHDNAVLIKYIAIANQFPALNAEYASLMQMPFPQPLVYYTIPNDCSDSHCKELCDGIISTVSGVNITALDTLGDQQQVYSFESQESKTKPSPLSSNSTFNIMELSSGDEGKYKVKANPNEITLKPTLSQFLGQSHKSN